MSYGWEGNRRSGVTLTMRHVVYPPQGLSETDEHPTYTLLQEVWHSYLTGNSAMKCQP